jgi:hypothetical protein
LERKAASGIMLILLLTSMLTLAFNIQPVKASSENGLVGYWKFDEGSGNTAADSSGNGNTGALQNGPVWVDGKYGKALRFDGVSNYVRVEDSNSLHLSTAVTLMAWIYLPTGATYADSYIVAKEASNGGANLGLKIHDNSGHVVFNLGLDGGYTATQLVSTNNVVRDSWTHVAATYDGSLIAIYINGVLDSSVSWASGFSSNTNPLTIGSKNPPYVEAFINATIDEVRIYSRALSQQEIQTDMGVLSYTVTFRESGLPQGYQWAVTFNGQTQSSTSNSITFSAANGVYPFSITPPTGYMASPSSGNITVSGANVVEQITFSVVVTSNPLWTDTRLNTTIGEKVEINASGWWSGAVYGGPWFGPDGQLGKSGYGDTFLYEANWGELIAFVGSDPYQGHWGDGSFFPQHTGYWIIGSSGQFVSNKTGELWLGFNDDAVSESVGDNGGTVTASITITSGPVEVSITPSKATTSIGGTAIYDVEIINHKNVSDTFAISLQGLNSSWYSLSPNYLTLVVGEVAHVTLNVSVPEDPSKVGTYQFNVFVSGTQSQVAVSASLVVLLEPIMSSLEPGENTTVGSTGVLFFWQTSSNASSEVYIKRAGDTTFNHIVGAYGKTHYVYAFNLSRNTDYVWYAYSKTTYGNVSSDTRTLHVSNGVSFTQRSYTFNVQRDYAQNASVSVVNTDTVFHKVLLQANNTYNDLIVGFVGPGSVDKNLTLQPGETKAVDLEIFAQDAMQQNYTFTTKLTNLGNESIVDYALVHVNVKQPNINLVLVEDSTDPATLSKTITATNYGDPITDLFIGTSNNLVGKVYFNPTINHANLPTGGSLTFEVTPVLTTNFTGYQGLITATSASRVITSLPVNFTLPPGKSVFSATVPQMSIEFSKYYDTDNSPNTNPLSTQPIESYLANGTLIFASQIIVDVYQNGIAAYGANVSLTVWNETGAVESVEYSETDFTGKAMFVVYGKAGNYSYQAELVGYGIKTERRNFSVDTNPLFQIHPRDITWLDVSDGNSTFDLSQNVSRILLDKAPFVFRGRKATIEENATVRLVLTWNSDKFKKIFVSGSILNNTIVFKTSGIPEGNFSAVILYYSNISGLSLSNPINVTNKDWSAMYLQGNYTYWQPFPLNSTHFIRLSIERLVNSRNPIVAFDLYGIQPTNNNSLYRLTYFFVSNETIQKEFQICVKTSSSVLYNNTFSLDLKPWIPVLINFTIPAYFDNGTLRPQFNATISSESSFVTLIIRPSIQCVYDTRIWAGSDWGFLPSLGISLPSPSPKVLLTCGGAHLLANLVHIPGFYPDAIEFVQYSDDLSRLRQFEKYLVGGIGAMAGAVFGGILGTSLGPPGTFAGIISGATGGYQIATTLYDIVECIQDWQPVQAEALKKNTGIGQCRIAETGVWYCTNRPVVADQFSVDSSITKTTSPEVNIDRASLIVRFVLPWPRDTYRPHNVHLLINGIEIGNLINTIPEGYYIFPFNGSILNYASEGVAQNTITLKTDHLNGGHYVVSTDIKIVLHLKRLKLAVVASNQTEAGMLVEQLSGTVANLPDFGIYSQGIAFSNSQPTEGEKVTISAKIFNFGTVGMLNVPIDLYVDSAKVVTGIIFYIPALTSQTINFTWTGTRGSHNITIKVNDAKTIPEIDYSNNQAQKNLVVYRHDIAITNVTPRKTVTGQGYPNQITVTIQNPGDFDESFNVTIYANSTIVASQMVALAKGTSTPITFTWNTAGFAKGKYTISAYAWPVPGETDTADNTYTGGNVTVAMVGDITGSKPDVPDGIVDITDIATVAKCFGAEYPDSRYKPNCDINNDGTIDIWDIARVAKNYGKTDP